MAGGIRVAAAQALLGGLERSDGSLQQEVGSTAHRGSKAVLVLVRVEFEVVFVVNGLR